MNKKTILEIAGSVQHYLVIWILFFTPLLFLPFFEDTFRFSKIIFFYLLVNFLFLINIIKVYLGKSFFIPIKAISFSIFFFVFIFFLSTLTSIHWSSSFFGLHQVYIGSFIHVLALLVFAFSVLQIDWRKKLNQLSAYMSAAAAIVSIFALKQFSQYFYDFSQFYRVRSTIGEPNRLAYFLSASLPFCIFLFITTKQRWIRFSSFMNCLLIFTTILLTFSRSSWIAIFLSSVIVIITLFSYLKDKFGSFLKRFIQGNQFYLVLLLMLFAFFSPSLGKEVFSRNLAVIKDLKTGEGSINIRLQNWQTVLQIVKNREKWYQHILGTGPSTIGYSFLKNRPSFLNKNPVEKDWITMTVRNQFLDLLNNVGILGLVSFIMILVITFLCIFKDFKKFVKRPIFWPAFVCFLTIFFTSFFYYQTITTSIYFWFSLGLLLSLLKKQNIQVKKAYSFPVLILGICLFLGCLFVLTRIILADLAFSNRDYEKAVSLNPYNDFYKRQLAYFLLKQAEEEKDFGKAKLAIKASEQAAELNRVCAINQKVLQVVNYRTGIFFDKKFHQKALEVGEKRILLDPNRADPYETQGLVYLDLGQLDKALEYFQRAIEIDSDYLAVYLHVGETLKQMGKIDEAIDYYQLALQKNPNWLFAQKELEKAEKLKKTF